MPAQIAAIHHYAAGNRFGTDPATRARIELRRPFLPAPATLAEIAATLPDLPRAGAEATGGAASFGRLAVDLVTALIRRAGEPVAAGRVLPAPDPATTILFGHRDEAVAREALRLALRLLLGERDGRVADMVAAFTRWAEPRVVYREDAFLVAAAAARGIPWRPSRGGRRGLQLGEGARLRRAFSNLTDRAPFLGVAICTSKWLANRALQAAGLPVTRQRRAESAAAAVRAAAEIGYPVVVKPVAASRGAGVACDLGSAAEVAGAFAAARSHGPVIVEGFVRGDDHRRLVIGGRFACCIRRRPAALVADGVRSVAALVAAENARPERGTAPDRPLRPLLLDAESERLLRRQGLDRESVPAAGTEVRLRSTANWSQGGSTSIVTDGTHPANRLLAERVAALVGLDIVGVDLITPDIGRPLGEVGGKINEVQRQPAIGALRRAAGDGDDRVHRTILELLVPPSAQCRIPVVAVVGGDAAAVAGHLVAALAATGRSVGLAGSGGLTVGALRRTATDVRDGGLALLVDDPSVEAAVAELDARAILDRGVGHDRIDVVVVGSPDVPAAAVAVLLALAERGVVCAAEDGRTREAARRAKLGCAVPRPAAGGSPAAAAFAAAALALLASGEPAAP
ncbi:MAG: acetate--CoA ligase family protein [Alphaproteobacteria bacterium]|nr:acetate--CoA ligase family protein [Alphaproteobacteria bacterium]